MLVEKKASIISVPLDISVNDIQNQINLGLPDLIYEDKSFTDNNNDGLKVKVWRKGNLIFTENKDGVLTYEVPLKVWAQKEISVLGISQAPSTTFEIKIKFASKFGISDNYEIITETKGLSYTWLSKPVLKSGLIDIPIGSVIGNIISSNLPVFAGQIDQTIKQNYSLKPYVVDAWNLAMKPIQASEEFNTWIKVNPVEVYYTPLKSVNTSLKATLGIKVFIETLVGTPFYTPSIIADVPKLKAVSSIPEEFEVSLFNVITYEEANNISKKMFIGEKFEFNNGKYKIEVTDLDISHKEDQLLFTITTTGSFKGKITVQGVPFYNTEKKMVVLTNTNLDVKTKNILYKAAAWILNGTLEKKIEKDFGMPVSDILEFTKKSVMETINSEYSKGIKMQGNILSIDPDKVYVTEEGILALVNAKAKVQLIVKGI